MTVTRRLARPLPLTGRAQARLLGLLAVASFFEGYDLNVVMVALPAIRHSFGLSQAQAADWIAVLFLGALPAVFIARRADRHGRRRLLLVSAAGYTAATVATALAPGIAAFGTCQLCARAFLAVEITLTWTPHPGLRGGGTGQPAHPAIRIRDRLHADPAPPAGP